MVSQGAWDGDCATWTRWHDPTAEESVVFSKMNGTGPFKFERWLTGEEWSIVRNDSYWLTDTMGGRPQRTRGTGQGRRQGRRGVGHKTGDVPGW